MQLPIALDSDRRVHPGSLRAALAPRLFHYLHRLERWAALQQGKGFCGPQTPALEIAAIAQALDGRVPLIVFDVGGNVGNWTALARARFPDAEIHCFEPSRSNVRRLAERFAADARVRIVDRALSSRPGARDLFADRDGSGLASLHQRRLDHFNLRHERVETVEVDTLDAYCRRHAIVSIDVLKLDVEGHEIDVLTGGADILARTRVVQFEFGGTHIDSRCFFQDYFYLFTRAGFRILRLTPHGLQPVERYREEDEYFRTTNFLAVRG